METTNNEIITDNNEKITDNNENNNEIITDYESNIKHKSMLMNGTPWPEIKNSSNLTTLDLFLENEKKSNINEPWSKLDKMNKNKKLGFFAEKYKEDNNLNEEEYSRLLTFFKECLTHKKLQRVKDVIYDKVTGIIKDVPALIYNKNANHFTLKNIDKRISTIKSLAPRRNKGSKVTIKNVIDNDNSDEEI